MSPKTYDMVGWESHMFGKMEKGYMAEEGFEMDPEEYIEYSPNSLNYVLQLLCVSYLPGPVKDFQNAFVHSLYIAFLFICFLSKL